MNEDNEQLGHQLESDLIGFSEAAAGNLLGWSGGFVGLLKRGLAKFTPEIIRHLADRLPLPYGAFWRELAKGEK